MRKEKDYIAPVQSGELERIENTLAMGRAVNPYKLSDTGRAQLAINKLRAVFCCFETQKSSKSKKKCRKKKKGRSLELLYSGIKSTRTKKEDVLLELYDSSADNEDHFVLNVQGNGLAGEVGKSKEEDLDQEIERFLGRRISEISERHRRSNGNRTISSTKSRKYSNLGISGSIKGDSKRIDGIEDKSGVEAKGGSEWSYIYERVANGRESTEENEEEGEEKGERVGTIDGRETRRKKSILRTSATRRRRSGRSRLHNSREMKEIRERSEGEEETERSVIEMEAPRLEDIGHREWEEQSAISNWDDDFVFESPEKGTPKKKNKKGENNRKMEKKKQGKVYDVEKDVLEQIKVIEKLYQSCKELKRVREEIIESLRRVRGEDFFYGSQRSFAETVRSGGEKEPSEEEENLWEAWRQAEAFLLLSNNGYGNNGRGNGGRGGRDDGGVYGDRNEKIDFGVSGCFLGIDQQNEYIRDIFNAIISNSYDNRLAEEIRYPNLNERTQQIKIKVSRSFLEGLIGESSSDDDLTQSSQVTGEHNGGMHSEKNRVSVESDKTVLYSSPTSQKVRENILGKNKGDVVKYLIKLHDIEQMADLGQRICRRCEQVVEMSLA